MISIEYAGKSFSVAPGTTVEQFLKSQGETEAKQVLGVRMGNIKVLRSHVLEEGAVLTPLTLCDSEGIRIYKNSLIFIVVAVVKKLFPDWQVVINHTISGGIYCTVAGGKVTEEVLSTIDFEIRKLVEEDHPIEFVGMSVANAQAYFERIGWHDTAAHLRTTKSQSVSLCGLNGQLGFTFGSISPSTGYLKLYELLAYDRGFIIRYPRETEPNTIPKFVEQPKLFGVFREFERWQSILSLRTVSDLNQLIVDEKIDQIIHVAESLHEKKIAKIADDICHRIDDVRAILIAGPSSSGKTTFSKRLAIHLKVNGINTLPISLDDYFTDRVNTPRDENGEYDFESIYALNLELFNDHLRHLLGGDRIELPRYDFSSGLSRRSGKMMQLDSRTLLIIEGIHGLNDELTSAVYELLKYRIYVSAFTPIGVDNTNRIPTTDLRLIRRIVRDNSYRGYSAADTIKRWPLVRHGEKKWIFPHQNKADVLFNSTLVYEPAVLRSYAQPLLEKIGPDEEIYEEATRLREFLSLSEAMDHTKIPGTSILREFIGGSHFRY